MTVLAPLLTNDKAHDEALATYLAEHGLEAPELPSWLVLKSVD